MYSLFTTLRKRKQWLMFCFMALLLSDRSYAAAPDREDDVDGFRLDVFVVVGGHLQNPIGFCRVEPCGAGETSPNADLFSLVGIPLDLTWGEFQMVEADSRVSCRKDGTTNIRIGLTGLIPNGVYSIFYRTFGPDSINPFCPNEERSIVVPNLCNGSQCEGVRPDSKIISDANGEATFVGQIDGCLLNPTTALLDVIYHLNGDTYFELPNQLEFQTQLTPCQADFDCAGGDICLSNVCQPQSCSTDPLTCRVCHSSFGNDAMRQAVIIQKAP